MYEGLVLALTFVAAVVLLGTVAVYVIRITAVLDHLGGKGDTDLAKIGWGVRAIDKETAILPAGVPELNSQLRTIRDGLLSIDRFLVTIVQAQR